MGVMNKPWERAKLRAASSNSDVDYMPDEVEFMNAMDRRKRDCNKLNLTCREVLEVAYSLGYRKQPAEAQMDREAQGQKDLRHLAHSD